MKFNIKKVIFVAVVSLVLVTTVLFSCQNKNTPIKGYLTEEFVDGDTIYISTSYNNDTEYGYEIRDNQFDIDIELPYPQAFKIRVKSEAGKIAQRAVYYFLDNSTKSITVLKNGNCSEIDGVIASEYINQFVPFILSEDYDCNTQSLDYFIYTNKTLFDTKLLEYINKNPNSYVGLHFLIDRINNEGHKAAYVEMLSLFSKEIKDGLVWKVAKDELNSLRIQLGKQFPILPLKNLNENIETIDIKENKLTLVDYWFNSCRPCLEKFEVLKPLYSEYKSKGFELVGISTDRTEDIPAWKKIISQKKYDWSQYLDENAVEATKDKITEFPTSYLLDENGVVLLKNPTITDLKKFLEAL